MYGQNWLEGRQVVGLCLKKSGVQSTSYPCTAMTKQSKANVHQTALKHTPFPALWSCIKLPVRLHQSGECMDVTAVLRNKPIPKSQTQCGYFS